MKKILLLLLAGPLGAAAQIQTLSCSSSSITGAANDACTVTLSSPASSAGLTVSLTSSNAAVTLPSHIWAGPKSTSVGFTLTAGAVTQAQTATITAFYNLNGVNSPRTYSLNLYPLPTSGSLLTVTPVSLLFGSVALNTPSTMSVTLKNTGNSMIAGTTAVSGKGFSTNPVQVRLYAGRTMTVAVQFDPTGAGATTGKLNIQTDAQNPLLVVPMSGTGAGTGQHSVTLDWNAPSSSPEPIAGYVTYRSANGGGFAAVNSTPTSASTYTDTGIQAGNTYSYYVESIGTNGWASAPSSTVKVSVP